MKHCPKCYQKFTEEWLTFCTQDGTPLVEEGFSAPPPPSTTLPPSAPSISPAEQPTMHLPQGGGPLQAKFGTPPSLQSGWQPPPVPAHVSAPQQSLAVLSLVLGIASMTVGWCCYFGVLTAPIAIGLGIFALVQIKNNPTLYTGKGTAIAGIITGGLYFVFLALITLIYGLGILMGGLS